jgi:uncharacterized protein
MAHDLNSARYVAFVSYKKDGTPVSTPVWIVPFENGFAFTTEPNSYKVRRIRNNSRVTLTRCDMRGKIADGARSFVGTAEVLDEHDARSVEALVAKKYWIGVRLLGVLSLWKKISGKGSTAGDAAIKVTLTT